MGKTRNKQHSEIDHLRGENRRLKSENRHLKKVLKQSEKWKNVKDDVHCDEIDGEEAVIIERVDECPKCEQGRLRYIDLKHVQLFKCDNKKCDYREKAKG